MGGYATNPDTNSASEITGSGTANYMAKFTAAQVIGNSTVQDDGTTVSTTSLFRVGNPAAPGGSLSQMRVGKGTAIIDFGEAAASSSAIWFQRATPTTNNYAIHGDAATTIVNGSDNVILYASAVERLRINRAQTSGTTSALVFTGAADTGMTASTEIPKILFTLGSRQWATGAITTQREVYITSPTYSFVGASTITNAYGMYVKAPTAGTNATITNNYAAGFSGNVNIIGDPYINGVAPTGTGSAVLSTSPTFVTSVNMGAATATGRFLDIKQDTAFIALGSLTTDTATSAIYMNQATPSGTNYTLRGSSSTSYLNGSSAITFNVGGTQYGRIRNSDWNFSNGVAGAGSAVQFLFTCAANTNQTLSTNIPNFKVTGATTQWATGALATQYFNYFSANTVSFVGASTATNVYSLFVEGPVAGTNATLTNTFSLGLSHGSSALSFGNLTGVDSYSAIYFGTATATSSNYTFSGNGSEISINAPSSTSNINFRHNGSNTLVMRGAVTSGSSPFIDITPAATTGRTASTEVNGLRYIGTTRTWAAGAITTQREWTIATSTYAFASASTITNSYGLYVEAATAGTNATITNNYALGTAGGNVIFNTGVTTTKFSDYYITGSSSFVISATGGGYMAIMSDVGNSVSMCTDNSVANARVTANGLTTNNHGIIFDGKLTSVLTASTEYNTFRFQSTGKSYATGAIATYRNMYVLSNTITFAGASTITDGYGAYFVDLTAGTNATITNNYAAGFSGNVQIIPYSIGSNGGFKFQALVSAPTDNCAIYCSTTSPSVSNFALNSSTITTTLNATTTVNIGISNGVQLAITASAITVKNAVDLVFSGTTGTKLGTATTQKIGFWNATPIVQPTTAVTAATFVENTSGIENDTATFDGYTIGQVVKALRNEGLLA